MIREKEDQITFLEEGYFLMKLILALGIGVFCLIAIFLKDVNKYLIGYFPILIILFYQSFKLGTKTLKDFYNKRVRNNTPKLLEDKYLVELVYKKDKWLSFKKEEYNKKKKKINRANLYFIVPILVFLLLLLIMELLVGLIMTYFFLFFYVAIKSVIHKAFKEEYFNNIEFKAEQYIVKIYRTGLVVNNWYCPYNKYLKNGSLITLKEVNLIDDNEVKYLEFRSLSKSYHNGFGDDFSSGELLAKGILRIPILEHQNLDLKKLRKKLLH